ncbi:MAG: MarR family winged helix-turn-helix transcriptional regulator [Acidimicrobiales bacterium]
MTRPAGAATGGAATGGSHDHGSSAHAAGGGSRAPDVLSSALRLSVSRLARRLRQQSPNDVTASQYSALVSLDRHGAVSLGELAAIEQIAPPSMTRITARLEEAGLVERRVDSADRRVARVVLSAVGARVLESTRTTRDLFLAHRLQLLSTEELECLSRAIPLLERLSMEDSGA